MTLPKWYDGRWPRSAVLAVAIAFGAVVIGACDDEFSFGPDIRTDTATVYSLAVPELNLPSAYSFGSLFRGPQILETVEPGIWDLAIDTQNGVLVAVLPADFGLITRTRITTLPNDPVFETVVEAPQDTLVYSAVGPIPLSTSEVYVMRSHEEQGTFGARCTYFTKFQPTRLDLAAGVVDFISATNANCNDRRLVPENP